jgi:hypothetical protein
MLLQAIVEHCASYLLQPWKFHSGLRQLVTLCPGFMRLCPVL